MRNYFKLFRHYILLICTAYFWVVTVKVFVHSLQIPAYNLWGALQNVLFLSYHKAVVIHLDFGKMGPWYVEPDFEYFIALTALFFIIFFSLKSNWKTMVIAMILCVFIPQTIAALLIVMLVGRSFIH
jgi:hypothetical protein